MIPQVAINRRFSSVRVTVGNRNVVVSLAEARVLKDRLTRAMGALQEGAHPDSFEEIE